MEEISVKLYSPDGGEVRRFPFQVPAKGSGAGTYAGIYSGLLEKVKQLYPANTKLQLVWKDDEGDMITMNTDDEVKEALRNLRANMLRIYVRFGDEPITVRADSNEGQEAVNVHIGDDCAPMDMPQPEDQAEEKGGPKNHWGVYCDGCDQSDIEGKRFKCLICSDYDLCETCEGKHVHDQHPMVRVTAPGDQSWVPAFMAVQGMHRVRGPPMHFRRGRGGRGRCPFFAPENTDRNQQQNQSCNAEAQQTEQQRAQDTPGVQFLRDVGQAVAAVLNGFGVNVDIDVEHEGQRSKVATPKANGEKKETGETPVQKEEKKQDTAAAPVDQPMENVASPPAAEKMETGTAVQVSPDGQQDWTILDTADTTTTASAGAAASAAAPSAPPVPDPRVAAAVNYMLAMGFTNEGGWLSQLLEAKGADIGAVLDILHPSLKE